MDAATINLTAARALGEAGQQRATARAERDCEGFSSRAEAAILAKLAAGQASGEDLTDYVRACGVEFKDGRSLGGVIAGMSRRGLIEVCGGCLRRFGHSTAGGRIWRLKP